jgi:hypothetical protein
MTEDSTAGDHFAYIHKVLEVCVNPQIADLHILDIVYLPCFGYISEAGGLHHLVKKIGIYPVR